MEYVSDHLKIQGMCDKAVRDHFFSLQFVIQEQTKKWHDDSKYYDDDRLIEWYKGYQKRKAQKVKIKKELMSIVWHPSRWWN